MNWLLDAYRQEPKTHERKDVEKIKLSQLVSRLGFFYEKFRNAIDYNEEHLIRRNSLRRFLRRQFLFLGEKDARKISLSLIHEFIRARYLPNETLPETLVEDLALPLVKYLIILNHIHGNEFRKKDKLVDWMIELAACEIDEFLFPPDKELAMANFMYSQMVSSLVFAKAKLDEQEKNLQIYIAVLKTLLRADQSTLYYRLLNLHIPNWTSLSPAEVNDFAKGITEVRGKLDEHLSHPIGFQLSSAMKKQAVFFTILREVLLKKEVSVATFENEAEITDVVKKTCDDNYHRIHSKLMGSIARAIIYILMTKTVLAFILEVPYDLIVIGHVDTRALVINIVFHPILMAIVAMTIRVPGAKNTQIIIDEVKKIAYGAERKIIFKAKHSMQKGFSAYVVMNVIYLIMFIISFGVVIYVLDYLEFNLFSGLLFLFFLTLVSFFGFRLRNLANRFLVLPRKDNFRNFLVDFFTLPVIRVGRAVSTNFAKVNVFVFFLDFMIETPFKAVVDFFEKAVSFIREKREEISDN